MDTSQSVEITEKSEDDVIEKQLTAKARTVEQLAALHANLVLGKFTGQSRRTQQMAVDQIKKYVVFQYTKERWNDSLTQQIVNDALLEKTVAQIMQRLYLANYSHVARLEKIEDCLFRTPICQIVKGLGLSSAEVDQLYHLNQPKVFWLLGKTVSPAQAERVSHIMTFFALLQVGSGRLIPGSFQDLVDQAIRIVLEGQQLAALQSASEDTRQPFTVSEEQNMRLQTIPKSSDCASEMAIADYILDNKIGLSMDRAVYGLQNGFLSFCTKRVNQQFADALSIYLSKFQKRLFRFTGNDDTVQYLNMFKQLQVLLYLTINALKAECYASAPDHQVLAVLNGIGGISDSEQFCSTYALATQLFSILAQTVNVNNFLQCVSDNVYEFTENRHLKLMRMAAKELQTIHCIVIQNRVSTEVHERPLVGFGVDSLPTIIDIRRLGSNRQMKPIHQVKSYLFQFLAALVISSHEGDVMNTVVEQMVTAAQIQQVQTFLILQGWDELRERFEVAVDGMGK